MKPIYITLVDSYTDGREIHVSTEVLGDTFVVLRYADKDGNIIKLDDDLTLSEHEASNLLSSLAVAVSEARNANAEGKV